LNWYYQLDFFEIFIDRSSERIQNMKLRFVSVPPKQESRHTKEKPRKKSAEQSIITISVRPITRDPENFLYYYNRQVSWLIDHHAPFVFPGKAQ